MPRSRGRSRGRPTQPERRYVDVLYTDQHVRRAHIEHARGRSRLLAAVAREAPTRLGETGGALCAITGNPEPELFADLDGGRVGKARMREVAEASLALSDGLCNWTIVAYPNAGWAETVFGEPDVERLWAGGRPGGSPRRARSGRGLARTHRPAPSARSGAERAPVRPPPLPRSGHRPDDRTARGVGLASGARRVRRHQARREHADRGGLHDPGRETRRRSRALDTAAADPGEHRAGPRGAVRGRPRRRGACRVGRRGDAAAHRDRRQAPHASARSPSSTATRASARRESSSTTRCSTRTRRRTSHSARRSCRPSRGPTISTPRSARARRQPVVDPHRLHDRLERARDRRRRRGRRRRRRSSERRLGARPEAFAERPGLAPDEPAKIGTVGFEPTASASQRRRSDQAELRPVRRRVDVGSVGGP